MAQQALHHCIQPTKGVLPSTTFAITAATGVLTLLLLLQGEIIGGLSLVGGIKKILGVYVQHEKVRATSSLLRTCT
jgi:hypothetical protein